jgi:hypothetical protein
MNARFTPEHLDTWRRDGAVVIESFFNADEIAAVRADFDIIYGPSDAAGQPMIRKGPGDVGKFNPRQFEKVEAIPFDCSHALNLIGVHPALVAFAKAALGAEAVHLYQCQAWAKFTGEADYDQPFHCDFVNHTLTAPSEDAHLNSVTILCYFSDVSDAHGAMHYVTRPDSAKVTTPEATLDFAAQAQRHQALAAYERSSASPAGSIVPYGIDIYHRGTNLTVPDGARYAVMACFKAAGNDAIGFHAWPFHHMRPWARIFNHATPEQLACFGVQLPGDPFWTELTLARTQTRYPGWDMTPYREAMARG